ncbi:MAG: protease inhibitor I42 family protein [Candidatus Sericytochromatia bacterium]|nr:protease inhibitor I42 family protein [Candidatus Sericytochromatia bacterium]
MLDKPAVSLPEKIITVDFKDTRQTHQLKAGEMFAIKVPCHSPKDFAWQLEHSSLKPERIDYIKSGPLPAGGKLTDVQQGDRYYVFKAPESGSARIQLVHQATWGTAEKLPFEVQLDVKPESTKPALPAKIIQADRGTPQQISLKPGETFAIQVQSNASTGYSWQVLESGLQSHDQQYHPDCQDPMIVGSGGKLYYIFTAPEQGPASIQLQHGRSWEPKSQQIYTFNLSIE